VKISEVVEVLAGAELPHRAVRVAMGMWKGDGVIASPMTLDAVRKGNVATPASAPSDQGQAAAEIVLSSSVTPSV
jgi:hypothetical protein